MSDKLQDEHKKTYVPRVTQLDATEFDKEIHNVLSSELLEISKYLKPGALNSIKPEINLFLNLIIFYYSVINKNSTFGQQLLNLKYKKILSKKVVAGFVALNYLLPYLKNKYDDNSSRVQNDTIRKTVQNIELFIKACNFLNLLIFIRKGVYPTLVDRLLGLTFSPVKKLNRNVGYSYMTRELLWHGFMELLTHIQPLISYKSIQRKIKKVFISTTSQIKKEKDITYNTETKCVICNDFPTIPCQISKYCSHLACYYCIKSNILADEKFMCPICSETNTAHEHLKFLQG